MECCKRGPCEDWSDCQVLHFPCLVESRSSRIVAPHQIDCPHLTMSTSICLRCLARPARSAGQAIIRPAGRHGSQSSFSTSASLAALPMKKKGAAPPRKIRAGGGASYRPGKLERGNQRGGGGKPPAPGERKALRKKVVLGNTNALEIEGMEDLSRENMSDSTKQNQVLGFSQQEQDALQAAEAFKPTQGWKMFRRPATLVRKETIQMAEYLGQVSKGRTTFRKILHGERSSGKSVLALQAMAMAFIKGWVVVHIPEGQYIKTYALHWYSHVL